MVADSNLGIINEWTNGVSRSRSGGSDQFGDEVAIHQGMNKALIDHYRCVADAVSYDLSGHLSEEEGYFRFGQTICYGRSTTGHRTISSDVALYDVLRDVAGGADINLPFNPTDVVDNLRFERYANQNKLSALRPWMRALSYVYYSVRPMLGVNVRKHLQRARLIGWRKLSFPSWPVDTSVEDLCEQLLLLSMKATGVEKIPFIWFWPDGARSAAVMTHDIETEQGKAFCTELMDIDDEFGIRSSVQVVPEGRYDVSEKFLDRVRKRNFEVNVQDLNHDGRLFYDREEFLRRAQKINQYARNYNAAGFRAAVLYRNLDWYNALQFSYDMSVPNVAHLDPQRGGCCTIFPYFVGEMLEIPLTTTQDYTLFHLLGDYSLDLWKSQVKGILAKNGLISFIVHPDYIIEQRARKTYKDLLMFLRRDCETESIWFAVPGEIDRWWRQRSQMQLVRDGRHWKIIGDGCERAALAFARVEGSGLRYETLSGR
jgi:hypothetical protein